MIESLKRNFRERSPIILLYHHLYFDLIIFLAFLDAKSFLTVL